MVKVEHPARRQIKPVSRPLILERLHRPFDFFFNQGVLRFKIKGTMLKNDVGSLCNVHQLHLRRNGPRICDGKTDTVRLRKRYAPAADPSLRLVDKPHHLPAAAVGFRCAQIIQLVRNAAQQPANGFMVLPGNQALFLPEVPVADAFIVADVQKLVSALAVASSSDHVVGISSPASSSRSVRMNICMLHPA